MICAKTLLLAFVALTLLTVAQAAQPTISHNAAVRRHAAMIQARPAHRSVTLASGSKMVQKRQTAEQIAQAAALKKWDDDFHAKNAEWQQAAIADLNAGKTPPSFDEYWNGKSGGSSSPSSSDSGSSTPTSSSDSSAQSSSTPAQQEQPKQQQTQPKQEQTQPKPSSTPAPSNNNNAGSSQGRSGSDSDECEEDTTPASTSTPQTSTPASGAGNAAATGSKNNAAQNTNNSGSSQSTTGHFSGQATYYAPGLGACGKYNGDSDYIVAISHSLFDSFGTGNPNNNPACGHKIAATYGGKTITVSVADRCEGCAWGDLDFTPSGFAALADMSLGRLNGLTWSWIGAAP
ncbi:RlpA-like double-psi beta-barrel domain protein [Kalmanozyma brasiliensis GHG001]|uniref:RlpA-like protein double-psi beta-barrel domain-containing protein n=1 Tax=Kalmanozyma brasiliensis (strain GHG001) TaxID=1365824 RepID=V5E6A4_KALBG|nr:RlpA-like double-psi beta-barrel domain protein [Kalmanozyma brasiliensis GHG001]EST05791.1 RlpA-like double-psi beta-barrel domain protein [Kalmanozyma brasiliensis GHG001]